MANRTYRCSECGVEFETREKLDDHSRRDHPGMQRREMSGTDRDTQAGESGPGGQWGPGGGERGQTGKQGGQQNPNPKTGQPNPGRPQPGQGASPSDR
jgi:hypothetical protein